MIIEENQGDGTQEKIRQGTSDYNRDRIQMQEEMHNADTGMNVQDTGTAIGDGTQEEEMHNMDTGRNV